MDSVRDSCPEEIYPYIVDNLVKPCINGNIDPNLISRHSVVNVESKTIPVKWTKVVNSLKSSGKPILFPKQHFDYVNVKNGDEKFFATVDQYESEIRKNVATFKLDVEETLELALSLPLKRLSVMYNEEVFAYFRNLQIPVIEQNPVIDWSSFRNPSKQNLPTILVTKSTRNRILNKPQNKRKTKNDCVQPKVKRWRRYTDDNKKPIIRSNKKITDFYSGAKEYDIINSVARSTKKTREKQIQRSRITDFFSVRR